MIKDKENHVIAGNVYKINEKNSNIIEGETISIDEKDFRILSVENNKDNGMQAMAVAPVDSNGEVKVFWKLNKQIKRV